jgi:hypothetical protein
MSYVEMVKEEDGLRIRLTDDGREFLNDLRDADGWCKGTDAIFCELLECELGNGWDMISPEEISALTSANIISDECVRDDHGSITSLGVVYWFPDYAIRSEIDDLLDSGEAFLPAAA